MNNSPFIKKASYIKGRNTVLRNATEDDAEFILSLRLDSNKNKYLSKTAIELQAQQQWLISYKISNDQAYFVIEDLMTNPIGTVRIYDAKSNSFCWGSWILKPNAPFYFAMESAMLIYDYCFRILGFKQSHFDVRKANQKVVKFHLNTGAKIVSEDEINYYFIFTNEDFMGFKSKYSRFFNKAEVIYV